MGFQQGLSGLNGAAKNLDVIGNNIANTSTAGFKYSVAQFADVYATSLYGSGGLQVDRPLFYSASFTTGTDGTNDSDTSKSDSETDRISGIAAEPGASLVVTDTNRRQARRWGSVRENDGYTEMAGEMFICGVFSLLDRLLRPPEDAGLCAAAGAEQQARQQQARQREAGEAGQAHAEPVCSLIWISSFYGKTLRLELVV